MHLILMYGLYLVLFLAIDVTMIQGFEFDFEPITLTELNIMALVMLYIYNENRKESRK